MTKEELIKRNKLFVLAAINLCSQLPNTYATGIFARQLIRCASSVGANYRAACRAKSNADFINKLKIVEEELDESLYFLDLIQEIVPEQKKTIDPIIKEATELLSIIVASLKTIKNRTS